jgi:hypothetical protein
LYSACSWPFCCSSCAYWRRYLRDCAAKSPSRIYFFLKDASNYDAVAYRDALKKIDLSTSYAEQVLKLHTIRQTKHNRFPLALLGLAIYLLAVLLYGVVMIVRVLAHSA